MHPTYPDMHVQLAAANDINDIDHTLLIPFFFFTGAIFHEVAIQPFRMILHGFLFCACSYMYT